VPFWSVIYVSLASLAVLVSLLLALQTWEHCRHARSCMRTMDRHQPLGRVELIVPCKGIDVDLAGNLEPLFRQDYHDYEITFVVESPDDPAAETIRRLMTKHRAVQSRLVVAGRAAGSGQKVHNLLAATAGLSADIEYLAFVDSDARPRPEWMRLLIARLDRPGLGATTGYRWFVPARPTLANYLLYSINCGVTMLLGVHNQHWIWGGSWAVRRDLFEAAGLRDAWQGTLSDDLVASRVLASAGQPTRFEPVAVVASPLDLSWKDMFAFLRRQYLVGRCYVPAWWAFGLSFCSLVSLAWLSSLAAIGVLLLDGSPWWRVPLGMCCTMYLVGVFRGVVRQRLVRIYFPQHVKAMRGAMFFDVAAGPLATLVNWLGMVASMFGRHIDWRGIRYRMLRGGQIRLVSRNEDVQPSRADNLSGAPAAPEPLAPMLRQPYDREDRCVVGSCCGADN
jgi:ceramide glucosyltransferase